MQLKKVIEELGNQLQSIKWNNNRLKNETRDHKIKASREAGHAAKLQKQQEEMKVEIFKLEDEKKQVQKSLKEKETELYNQKFKI